MAEFCPECFAKIFNEKPGKLKYVLSKDEDICEGCGKWKRIVVKKRFIIPCRLRMKLFMLFGKK